jgi:hypothetical protein
MPVKGKQLNNFIIEKAKNIKAKNPKVSPLFKVPHCMWLIVCIIHCIAGNGIGDDTFEVQNTSTGLIQDSYGLPSKTRNWWIYVNEYGTKTIGRVDHQSSVSFLATLVADSS